MNNPLTPPAPSPSRGEGEHAHAGGTPFPSPPRGRGARGEGLPGQSRVQLAAQHWRPRFVANGIDVNDFDGVVARTEQWADWAPQWKAMGEMHEGLGREAEARGRMVTAARAYLRAAWCYHLGKFLWFEDAALHAKLRERTVVVYQKALPHLDLTAARIE